MDDNSVLVKFRNSRGNDLQGKISDVIYQYNVDELKFFLDSIINEASWIDEFYKKNYNEESFLDSLVEALDAASAATKANVEVAFTELADSFIHQINPQSHNKKHVLTLLSISKNLSWGIDEFVIMYSFFKNNPYVDNEIEEQAALTLSFYPFNNDRKQFWTSLSNNFTDKPFLVYPLIIDLYDNDRELLLNLLKDAKTKPNNIDEIQSVFATILEQLVNAKEIDRILVLIGEAPTWVYDLFLNVDKEFNYGVFRIMLDMQDIYKYLEKYFWNKELQLNLSYVVNDVWDCNFVQFIDEQKYNNLFNIFLSPIDNFIKRKMKDEKNKELTTSVLDTPRLFLKSFLKNNDSFNDFDNKNLLSILPKEVLTKNQLEETKDIAILDIFKYCLVSNIESANQFEDELPVASSPDCFVNKLYIAYKENSEIVVFDKKAADAFYFLHDYLRRNYAKHFSQFSISVKLIPSQEEIIQRLNENNPILIVCTAPILAAALSFGLKVYVSLDNVKEQIKKLHLSNHYNFFAHINEHFIHMAANVHKDIKEKNALRIAAMIYFSINKMLEEDLRPLIQFIRVKMNDLNLEEKYIDEAIRKCYDYSAFEAMKIKCFADDKSTYPLKKGAIFGKKIFSNDYFDRYYYFITEVQSRLEKDEVKLRKEYSERDFSNYQKRQKYLVSFISKNLFFFNLEHDDEIIEEAAKLLVIDPIEKSEYIPAL